MSEFTDVTGALANVAGAAGQYRIGMDANEIALENLASQESAFSQTYEHQQEVFQYQRALQGQIFDREDTSVQRRVADLRAAGLSPVLAAGQGARAGAPISVNAPTRQAAQRSTGPQELMSRALMALTGKMGDISKTIAETANIQAQRAGTEQRTSQEARLFPERLKALEYGNKYAGRTLEDRIRLAEVAAKRATTEGVTAAYKQEIAKADANFKSWLIDDVVAGRIKNPATINALMAQLMLDIKKHDYEWYKSRFQPVTGQANWVTALQGLIGAGIGRPTQ